MNRAALITPYRRTVVIMQHNVSLICIIFSTLKCCEATATDTWTMASVDTYVGVTVSLSS